MFGGKREMVQEATTETPVDSFTLRNDYLPALSQLSNKIPEPALEPREEEETTLQAALPRPKPFNLAPESYEAVEPEPVPVFPVDGEETGAAADRADAAVAS